MLLINVLLRPIASAIAVIQLTSAIILSCQNYYTSARKSAKTIKSLVNRLTILNTILLKLREVALVEEASSKGLSLTLQILDDPEGVLPRCQETLEELKKKLDGPTSSTARKVLTALKWPFQEDVVNEAITKLDAYREDILLALGSEHT